MTLLILGIVGVIWVLGVFLSYVTGVGKSFKSNPSSAVHSSQVKQQSRDSAEETRLKQKQLMDDLKQKMEDNKRY